MSRWNAVSTLDRMLDDVMRSTYGAATNPQTFEPAIDVRANDNEILFSCDVPGLKEGDLELTLENRVLTIRGARRFEGGVEGEQVMLGRAYGTFSRAFTLPDSVDETLLSAQLADGVLTIRIPKHPKAKPRKIAIGNGGSPQRLNE
jgi:HSP20 family protein